MCACLSQMVCVGVAIVKMASTLRLDHMMEQCLCGRWPLVRSGARRNTRELEAFLCPLLVDVLFPLV